ncbi:hypothetical protein SRHO_G00307610 [Serrasalmus rhombeus]
MSRQPCFRMETKAVQCVLTTPVAREMVTSTGNKEDDKHIPDICPTLSIDPDDMRKHQEADDTLCTVRAWVQTDSQPSTSPMPVPSSSPGSPFPTILAPLSMTHSGRIVRPPAKFKNIVV